MSAGWAAFIAENAEQESPAERAVRLARLADQRDDREAERAEGERAAAVAERHELMQLAALQAGVAGRSAGDVFADAGRQGDEDAAYGEALKTIERIDKRRAQRQRDMADQAQRMAEVTGLAARSATTVTGGSDLLAEAKQLHRAFVETTRAKMRDAAAGAPRQERHPFVSRSRGGVAVRSEHCQWCIDANATDEEAFLLHSDPQRPLPVTPPGQSEQAAKAERRTPMIYAGTEISR